MSARRAWGSIGRRKGAKGWWIRYRDQDGRRRMTRGGATRKDAEARLLELRDEVLGPGPSADDLTLAEFMLEHLPRVEARSAKTTYINSKYSLGRVDGLIGPQAMRSIGVAEAADLFRRLRIGDDGRPPLAASTLRVYRDRLSLCWQDALDRGVVAVNPWRGLALPKIHEKDVPFLSAEDRAKLYLHCEAWVRPIIVLLAETGLRRGELEDLCWQDVESDRLTVRRSKTGRIRDMPLTPAAREALDELRRRTTRKLRGEDRVQPRHARNTIDRALSAALSHAGLPRLTPHGLRHVRAASLAQAGVPVPTAAAWLGHSARVFLARYGRWLPRDWQDDALRRLAAAEGWEASPGRSANDARPALPPTGA